MDNLDDTIIKSYKVYKIKKKKDKGGFRIIEAPDKEMLSFLYPLKAYLEEKAESKKVFDYSSKNKGIRKNAEEHLNKDYVLNLDIFKCFLSTKITMLEKVSDIDNYDRKLLELAFYNGHLPTCSPASNLILNIILYNLDILLEEKSKEYNIKYTRYVDDLTFSGNSLEDIYIIKEFAIANMNKLGYRVNFKKIRIQKQGERMGVTGLNINSGTPTVGRKFIKRLMLERKLIKKGLIRGIDLKKHEGKLLFLNDISKEMYSKMIVR
jgi:hypothetical protein